MAKARSVEAKLSRLASLRNRSLTAEDIEEVHKGLGDASNLVVAAAAALVAGNNVQQLAADLVTAFDRLMIEPEQSDKQCRGKIALVEALNTLEYSESDVFLRGIRHVQDRVWGDPDQDAAGPLRALCAFALARINHPGALLHLADLLRDRDKAARAGAARALGASGSLAAIPLLRFKVHLGDKEPEIIGECLEALLALAPDESLPFVAGFLEAGSEAVQEAALFALAESRYPPALVLLIEFWARAPESLREAVLLAIAMFRLPAAIDFLIDLVARKDPHARAALSALAIYRHQPKIRARIAAAVASNKDASVARWFDKKFPAESPAEEC